MVPVRPLADEAAVPLAFDDDGYSPSLLGGVADVSLAFDDGDSGAAPWLRDDALKTAALYEPADTAARFAKTRGMLAG